MSQDSVVDSTDSVWDFFYMEWKILDGIQWNAQLR